MTTTNETILQELSALRADVRALTKLVRRVRRHQEDPTGGIAKARSEKNGFNRPIAISESLRTFLQLEGDVLISRSDVTRRINQYIRENNLKHPDNGRIIVLDDKLRALFTPNEGEEITFLNIQRYISPHYIKTIPTNTPLPTTITTARTTTQTKTPKTAVSSSSGKQALKRPTVRKSTAA